MLDEIKSWLQLAQIGHSRSSITNPLQWTMVILIGAIVLISVLHLPFFVTLSLLCCLLLIVALFLWTFIYFMFKNPDVLRSEEFHLSKMKIERGWVGDNLTGLIEQKELTTGSSVPLEGSKLLGPEKDS